jgi:hypothetical protein
MIHGGNMNDLDFPDEPEYLPKLVDLHLGAAEVKPIQKINKVKEHKSPVITLLDMLVVLLGIGNVWLFISVWKWII